MLGTYLNGVPGFLEWIGVHLSSYLLFWDLHNPLYFGVKNNEKFGNQVSFCILHVGFSILPQFLPLIRFLLCFSGLSFNLPLSKTFLMDPLKDLNGAIMRKRDRVGESAPLCTDIYFLLICIYCLLGICQTSLQ